MALLLTVIIGLSMIVKAFTHIFTLGYLPSPIFANLLPHDGVIPSVEDDFGVALLKLGTACIEATQYSGLRNELASLSESKGPWVEITSAESEVIKRTNGGFALEITDIQTTALSDPARDSSYRTELKTFWQTCFNAFIDLAWGALKVTPGAMRGYEIVKRLYKRRWWYGPRGWRIWQRRTWDAPVTEQSLRLMAPLRMRARSPGTTYTYDQYLRGEVEMEDDNEDWVDEDDAESSGSASDDEEDDQVVLYQDLVQEDDDNLQPVLLAHLTSTTTLTRRRFAAMMVPSQTAIRDVVEDRRVATRGKERDEWDEDRRRCCVVCTTEQRDTVLWPCRCLALCNDCRESLASRLAAKDHMCP